MSNFQPALQALSQSCRDFALSNLEKRTIVELKALSPEEQTHWRTALAATEKRLLKELRAHQAKDVSAPKSMAFELEKVQVQLRTAMTNSPS